MAGKGEETGLIAILAFLVGGAIGAGVALLMAPQTGKKTRKQIIDFAEDVKDQTVEYAGKIKKKVT